MTLKTAYNIIYCICVMNKLQQWIFKMIRGRLNENYIQFYEIIAQQNVV